MARRQRTRKRRRTFLRQPIFWATVTLAVMAVVALIVVGSLTRGGDNADTVPASARTDLGRGKTLGRPDAPVTVVVYSDFQCPFCRRFVETTERPLEDSYVSAGKVYLVHQHFAFLGDESLWAAEASECANEQNKFWPYHDLLFSRQSGENRGAFTLDKLKRFAQDLGLEDQSGFAGCLNSGRYRDQVKEETQEGRRRGVNSTPTIFVNGRKVSGAATFDTLRAMIEEELARVQR